MHQQHSRYTYRTTSNLSSARRRLSIIYSLASIGGPRWLYGSITGRNSQLPCPSVMVGTAELAMQRYRLQSRTRRLPNSPSFTFLVILAMGSEYSARGCELKIQSRVCFPLGRNAYAPSSGTGLYT